ncbi:MAG: hypothetical protein HQ568_01805, partial [Calditrichaeota bacterium]|nr:hypothetical protein [Calditrichota bacterium]
MTPLMPAARWCWMLLITGIILGVSLSRESLAYTIEAEIMNPNAMIFPVGGMLPGNLSTADDVDFQSIATIFRMRVTDSDTTDPDTLILMVRLEVAGGDPIFTVSSTPISVPLVLCPLGWQRNDQLATVGPLHIGEGDDVNANQVLPYVDGGNLADNLYVLTVLLADPSMTSEDWASAENENYGIKSATTRVRNPSQVELVQPQFRDEVFSNPIFTWLFPRNPSVYFRLELASGDPDDDPSTALDFANESSLFVDTTFSAGFAASGEQTTYGYQGTGGERPLIPGRTYFWRVTAIAPTMFYQDSVFIECTPSRFEYGSLPEIEILEPADDVTFESKDPEFLWSYPQRPELSFKIEIVKGNFLTGDKYAEIEIDGGAGGQFSYTYGTSFNDLQLDPDTYEWRITATSIIEGISVSVESPIRSFSYEPKLELVWPVGSPRLILGARYNFAWRYPQDIPVSQFEIVLFKEGWGGLDAFKTWNAGGNERRLHWDETLWMGNYHWHVFARHPGGD